MVRAISVVCGVLLLCGAASGTDFVYVNPGAPVLNYSGWLGAAVYNYSYTSWDNTVNWTGGSGADYPSTAYDRANIYNSPVNSWAPTGKAGDNNCVRFTKSYVAGNDSTKYVVGEVTFRNNSYWMPNGSGALYLRVSSEGGLSGDYWFTSATSSATWGSDVTIDVDGNFRHAPTRNAFLANDAYKGLIIMRGNGKSYYNGASGSHNVTTQIYGSGVWDNGSPTFTHGYNNVVQVMPGGSIGSHTGVTGNWNARSYLFPNGQANLPTAGSAVNFNYSYVVGTDCGIGAGKLVVASGVTYPQDVSWATGWMGNASGTYEWKPKAYAAGAGADLGIGRDFVFNTGGAAYANIIFNTLENGTSNSVKFTVGRDLKVGTSTVVYSGHVVGTTQRLKFNNSTVKIGRDFIVGQDRGSSSWYPNGTAAVDFGNSTVNIGGNFTVYRLTPEAKTFWSAGKSTVVFDGNGGTGTQTIRINGNDDIINGLVVPLNNVVIDTLGTVKLDTTIAAPSGSHVDCSTIWDSPIGTSLRLTGDFTLKRGTWVGNGRPITFNGTSHLLTDLTGSIMDDNIILLAGSTMHLGSNITIKSTDNLILGAGACLYLDGHTLVAEGVTYDGCLCRQWTIDGGTVFGAQNVPEPATLLLIGSGLMGGIGLLRRHRME